MVAQRISQQDLLKNLTDVVYHGNNLAEIIQQTTIQIRSFLNVDRVKIYKFAKDASREMVAQSVVIDKLPSLK
ncbi:MAG: hypothetical protein F6K10_09870 [Moorea sp. SIO2B7]|nr:hypothetical protein [Moorena sp. SIO2B7]